jgi:CubicO group peptidase (beta-lactamase class C family)
MQDRNFALFDALMGIVVLLAVLCCDGAYAQDVPAPPVWPIPDWQTSTPEAQGMDSADLAKLVAYGKTKSFDSLLLARHGRIVLEAYYAPYAADIPHAINSSTKAVVGTLTAMLLKDGLLDSLDHPVLDFFRDRDIANVDEGKRAITVQQLLDMTSGLDWEEGFAGGREQSLKDLRRSPDWIKFILDRPMAHAPGEVFYYDSGNPHLLSAIIAKLTGKPVQDYADAKLLRPLGIGQYVWRRDPQGLATGGFGLSMLPRDMAKIGYLYLRHGEWAGERLLPQNFVDAVNHATVNMNATFDPRLRYANFFWAIPEKHIYMAVGYHCQVIMVLPDPDIVAVMTARDFCPFGKLADDISGAVRSNSARPSNPAAADTLSRALAEISTEKPTEVGATPDTAAAISGKTYRFADNQLDIKSLSLVLTGSDPHYELEVDTHNPANPTVSVGGPIGLDGLYRKSQPVGSGVRATKGSWLNDKTLAIDILLFGFGVQQKWLLTFDHDRLDLRTKDADGHELAVEGETGG